LLFFKIKITLEEDDDEESNQTVPTPPEETVNSLESASLDPGNAPEPEQEPMGEESGSITRGIMTSSTLGISVINADIATESAAPNDILKRQGCAPRSFLNYESISSMAAEVTISSKKTTVAPPSQLKPTRSSQKDSTIPSSSKISTGKKPIRSSYSPAASEEKVKGAVPVLKVITENLEITSHQTI
jgi:hypothetical protein